MYSWTLEVFISIWLFAVGFDQTYSAAFGIYITNRTVSVLLTQLFRIYDSIFDKISIVRSQPTFHKFLDQLLLLWFVFRLAKTWEKKLVLLSHRNDSTFEHNGALKINAEVHVNAWARPQI